jgi:hypothetical protein
VSRAFLLSISFVLAVLLIPNVGNAQPGQNRPRQDEPGKVALTGDGSEFFRALLHIKGVKPLKERELQTIFNYEDVIVIILGDPINRLRVQHAQLPQNIAQAATMSGGAVLVATPTTFAFSRLGNINQNEDLIDGARAECRDRDSILRKKHEDCPFAVPVAPTNRDRQKQAEIFTLFNGSGKEHPPLKRVVAGSPSFIHINENNFQGFSLVPVARLPDDCIIRSMDKRNGRLLDNDDNYFAVGGQFNFNNFQTPYRYVAFSSSRVFNNALLFLSLSDDQDEKIDNLELCLRTIDYLQGPNQHRKRCIFYENGQLIDHFDDLARATTKQTMPIPGMNMDSLQKKLVDIGNSQIDRLQKSDVPNTLVDRLFGLPKIVLLLLWAAAMSAIFFILKKVFGARKPGDVPAAPIILAATSQPPGVFERRQKELLRRNNVYEPVRDTVRDFFASLGIESDPGPRLPKLRISDEVHKPGSLRMAIKDLWRLAYGPPQVVNVNYWHDLEPYFLRVCQAHADGRWAFAFEEANVS